MSMNENLLRIESSPTDYARRGINPSTIEPAEDGRRTPLSGEYFEWWYFDALLDDGTVVVVTFADNWSIRD